MTFLGGLALGIRISGVGLEGSWIFSSRRSLALNRGSSGQALLGQKTFQWSYVHNGDLGSRASIAYLKAGFGYDLWIRNVLNF